ncbi:MAG: hypothetical protein ABI091_27265 [Ferruginibacter sp.]
MKSYQSVNDALCDLEKKGYKNNFESQTFCLYCGDLDLRLDPEDFHVKEAYSINGETDGDKIEVYAIATSSGVKGFVVDKNGSESNSEYEVSYPACQRTKNNIFPEKLKNSIMKIYQSLVDGLADLKERGYTADFEIESTCLYCSGLDLRMQPEEFSVDEVYRFEDNSSADDNAVLYAISSSAGVQGTLVDAYGVYAENMSFEIAKKLGMHAH